MYIKIFILSCKSSKVVASNSDYFLFFLSGKTDDSFNVSDGLVFTDDSIVF